MTVTDSRSLAAAIEAQIRKAVVGQSEAQRLLLIALLAGGHILLQGPPGTAKTLLCRAFARSIDMKFNRIQFTPDLMPGDVLGSNIFNFNTSAFELVLGPIFTELLLADEINRTPPKTQAALLEAMNERSVTLDGATRKLSDGFMVVGTQNPIEQQGTYPLPEAQLDRFLFMHILDYPSRDVELAIVEGSAADAPLDQIQPVADVAQLLAMRGAVAGIHLPPEVAAYVVDLVRATREHPAISFGASPRAAAMLARAARASAALDGRDFVIPDDVKDLVQPALRHRVILSPSAEIDGLSPDSALEEIVRKQAVPR